VPHTYDPVGRRFLAAADLPAFDVTDPDGDPVTSLGFTGAHAGDGPGTFEVASQGLRASLAISVPYLAPGDAALLIGAPGLSRTIGLSVVDANGGAASAIWDVVVTNRRPRLAAPLAPGSGDHGFDAGAGNYVASVPLGTVIDDDGDPVVQAGPTGDGVCPAIAPVLGQGPLAVRCAVGYGGVASLAQLVGPHAVTVQIADPFSTLVAGSTVANVMNRPPRIVAATQVVPAPCGPLECCAFDPDGNCSEAGRQILDASVTASVTAVDDDGDPLELSYANAGCATVLPATLTCDTGTCPAVEVAVCGGIYTCAPLPLTVSLTASDGLSSASGTLEVMPVCR
jgi:hypothetical protein